MNLSIAISETRLKRQGQIIFSTQSQEACSADIFILLFSFVIILAKLIQKVEGSLFSRSRTLQRNWTETFTTGTAQISDQVTCWCSVWHLRIITLNIYFKKKHKSAKWYKSFLYLLYHLIRLFFPRVVHPMCFLLNINSCIWSKWEKSSEKHYSEDSGVVGKGFSLRDLLRNDFLNISIVPFTCMHDLFFRSGSVNVIKWALWILHVFNFF